MGMKELVDELAAKRTRARAMGGGGPARAGAGGEPPADGVVTGFGRIAGRLASVIAYDFTVMAGSMGRTAEVKCNRAREIAYTKRLPMIWLVDSAGGRLPEDIGGTFA